MSEIQLQSCKEGDKIVYRLVCKQVSSPEFRSAKAAQAFLKSGMFHDYMDALSLVTHAIAEQARMINAKSDKELEEILNPPTLLTISQ